MRRFLTSFFIVILVILGGKYSLVTYAESDFEGLSESIDFVVSENISMTLGRDSDELTVSPFVIHNNSDESLKVKKISLVGQSGWSVVSRETADAVIDVNSKFFSLFTSEGYDLSEPLTDVATIEGKSDFVLNLMGKASLTARKTSNLHIGDFVVEVEAASYKTVLYEDGTLIINVPGEKVSFNEAEHGEVVAEYKPMTSVESYSFSYADEVLWAKDRASVKYVEFGSPVKPNDMDYWFYGCSILESMDSTNLDTSQVISMISIFERSGYNSEKYILDLSDWDTSKVENMSNAFKYSGYNSSEWTLNLKGWNTSMVKSMSGMFESSGYNATSWDAEGLDDWDTGNVTSFATMFKNVGKEKVKTFELDLTKWNTTSVKSMKSMFELAAYNASVWSIGDISNWKTLSLTNTELMFSHAGSSNYRLHNKDLSKWDTSKVTTMKNMFRSSATYEIKIIIPAGCIVDGMFDQKPTVKATLTFDGLPSSYSNIFRRAATSSTYGKINLVSSDAATKTWFNEMITLYGPKGTASKGYIYIA